MVDDLTSIPKYIFYHSVRTRLQQRGRTGSLWFGLACFLWHINYCGSSMPNPFSYIKRVLFQTIQFRISTQAILFQTALFSIQNNFISNNSV